MNCIRVANMNSLQALQQHEKGEVAWVEDIEKFYIWNDEWELLDTSNAGVNLSLYEVNKQVIVQLPTLKDVELEAARSTLLHYVNNLEHKDDYYMLLCYDLRYFTMFVRDQKYEENIVDAIMDCLSYVGEVKSVEESSDGHAIEIWVTRDNEAFVMYFFDYGRGVVLCQ